MKQKISQFEFAIMETITPDEAKKFEPRTDVEELNLRQQKLLNQVKNLSIHNVVGSTVTETTTRELEPYEFHCSKCNTIHKKTASAIAQHTMGVELIFTCTCGNKIDL